jgi:hypothetical protein
MTPNTDLELRVREAKMRELSNDLERFAPKRSDGERYARLHTLASSLAASLAFRYGEIAQLEQQLEHERAEVATARMVMMELQQRSLR